jgi:hypothetical protein
MLEKQREPKEIHLTVNTTGWLLSLFSSVLFPPLSQSQSRDPGTCILSDTAAFVLEPCRLVRPISGGQPHPRHPAPVRKWPKCAGEVSVSSEMLCYSYSTALTTALACSVYSPHCLVRSPRAMGGTMPRSQETFTNIWEKR